MRSEIYVTNLVKASVRARTFIANLLGRWVVPDRGGLLLRLPLTETLETLGAQLHCHQDQVFVKLATKIRLYMEGRPIPPFTVGHLYQLLVDAEKRKRVAQALGCPPQQVLDELFNVHAMLDTLFEVEPVEVLLQLMLRLQRDSLFPPADTTFRKVLEIHQKVAEHYKIGEFEWERLMDEHQWLRNSALTRLRSYAVEQGFAQATGAGLLAAAIDTHAYGGTIDEVHLDALAIIHIRQRIDWIVRQLREQAQELANKVRDIVPIHSPLARLQSHIEFYELKAPANAWRIAFGLKEAKSVEARHAPLDTLRNALANACGQFIPELIRSLILAGVDLPRGLSSTWDRHLSYLLPITPVEYDQDMIFPMSRADIMDLIRQDYTQRDNLRIIE